MDFRFANLKWWLFAGALWAGVLSAVAQNDTPQSGQPIVFSAPQNGGVPSTAPSTSPDNSADSNPQNMRAPAAGFNFNIPADTALPRPQTISPAEQLRLQKAQEDRNNWMLMTPGEILGVTTPEKILQTPEQRAADEKLTTMDRYLARQQEAKSPAIITNTWQNWNSAPAWDDWRNPQNPSLSDAARGDRPEKRQGLLDRIINGARGDASGNKNATYDWDSFSAPLKLPAQNPAQSAATFNKYLAQVVAESTPEKAPSDNKFLPLPAPDPNLEPQPVVNPNGATFTPLISGIGRPQGLTPLPSLIPPLVAQPVAQSSLTPPWLSKTPQPFVIPQRKF